MEIDTDIYNKLIKYSVIQSSHNHRILPDKQKVVLDKHSSVFFENGIAFGRFMLVINTLLVSYIFLMNSPKLKRLLL